MRQNKRPPATHDPTRAGPSTARRTRRKLGLAADVTKRVNARRSRLLEGIDKDVALGVDLNALMCLCVFGWERVSRGT